jgi:hypothetical protein
MAQTKPKAGQFYGVSNNGTDGQFLQTDGTGGMAWAATITDPTITSIDYPGTQTAADPAGGESVIINGTLFASGITCTVGGTSAVTAFNSATQITITTPAKAAGPYTVAVTNTDGGYASQANFIQYSGVPVWSTAAGTLGNVSEGAAASFQVTATEGSDTIEYAVTTGTLPTGLSLATATGAITGTAGSVSADTTTTFSITATDDENQTSASRSFSITVQNDAPSNHFNAVLYTGNQSARSIAVGFEPGFTWIKERNDTDAHFLQDSVRGSTYTLYSNNMAAQFNETQAVTSFTSTGFNLGTYTGTNTTNNTYVAWNFKAGGAAVANTDGTISSQVSVNNTLGFSIAKYTGTAVNGATVGHGLDAAPEIVFIKNLSGSSHWKSIMAPLGAGYALYLNLNIAAVSGQWNNTLPTTSVFTLDTDSNDNGNGSEHIAYCFASKPGFSKVGSYTGNGSTSGPMVQTGFEPAFVMLKCTTASGTSWRIVDNKRNTSNPRSKYLEPQSTQVEQTYDQLNFYSNGFQVITTDTSINASGSNVLYLAIAADGSTATPSLANSFATEIYTGNGNNQTITNVGFNSNFTWTKSRTETTDNWLFDTMRGSGNYISSDSTGANISVWSNYGVHFDTTNGFTVKDDSSGGYYMNKPSATYVTWNWKAVGTPAINTDGSTTSLVSANQAAGFSVVEYAGPSALNPGHGLGGTPDLIITKGASAVEDWYIYNSINGTGKYLSFTRNDQGGGTGRDGIQSNANTFSTVNATSFTTQVTSASLTYIAYCFKSISGYSKVGSYTGNGSSTGPIVTTGFQTNFVLIKRTDGTSNWNIYDTARDASNPSGPPLYPNLNNAEAGSQAVNFLSTGFQPAFAGGDINENNGTYIYLAIKEN